MQAWFAGNQLDYLMFILTQTLLMYIRLKKNTVCTLHLGVLWQTGTVPTYTVWAKACGYCQTDSGCFQCRVVLNLLSKGDYGGRLITVNSSVTFKKPV